MKSIIRGLSLISFAAALTAGATQGAEAQAYLRRFMPICEHIVMSVSPGAPPAGRLRLHGAARVRLHRG